MSTVVLLSEEVEELRNHGEPHEGCSGTYRLIPIFQDVNFTVLSGDGDDAVYLHHRLICDGCGKWGARIEDRGPADAEWNQPGAGYR